MYDELVKRLRSQCRGYGKECEDCNADGNCRSQMENEAADAIEELSKPRLISVEERLPEDGVQALVMRFDYVTKTPFYDLLWFDNGEWWNRHFKGDYAVTHWMPLPEPPKEET